MLIYLQVVVNVNYCNIHINELGATMFMCIHRLVMLETLPCLQLVVLMNLQLMLDSPC